MDLHRTHLKDVILPKIKSVYVIDYYEGVRGLLESRSDFLYKDIFANPRVRTKAEIIWSTDAFNSYPQKLVDLSGEDKEYYSYLLCKELESLVSLIDTLMREDGGMPLSELLSRAISDIDEKSVYCGDDKIVLVNWGLIPRLASFEGSGIYRSGKFIGDWDKAHQINPKQPAASYSFETTIPDSIVSAEEVVAEEECNPIHIEEAVSEDTPEADADNSISGTTDEITSNEITSDIDKTYPGEEGLADKDVRDSSVDISDKSEIVEVNDPKTEDVSSVVPHDKETPKTKPSQSYSKKHLFTKLWPSLKLIFRKFWWSLLLILLVVACLLGFRSSHGLISEYSPFYYLNAEYEKIRVEFLKLQMKLYGPSMTGIGSVAPSDTLKNYDVINDPSSLDGTWKSSTELFIASDHSPIVLYMTFDNLKGHLTMVNKELSFSAPLQASVEDKKIRIIQSEPAVNDNTNIYFVPYSYSCSVDSTGNLFCVAVSATNSVSFNLVRIK